MQYQKLRNQKSFGLIYFSLIILILISINPSIIDSTLHIKGAHASASIIINEIVYDPNGADTGYEWVELYNPLNTAIVLTGWKLQVAGSSFATVATIPESLIESKSFITICESKVPDCDIYLTKIAMQNGGDASDGIQILDSKDNVVDTVIYDSPNTNNLTNEQGSIVSNDQTAPASGSGKSLGRKNLVDTDNSYNDFYIFDNPTPGTYNTVSTTLQPTGNYPLLPISAFLLFILMTYSDRLKHYTIILYKIFNGNYKK